MIYLYVFVHCGVVKRADSQVTRGAPLWITHRGSAAPLTTLAVTRPYVKSVQLIRIAVVPSLTVRIFLCACHQIRIPAQLCQFIA